MPAYGYIAFLRGINVGGHHKVPMADLKAECRSLGFGDVITILNSGNIIFTADVKDPKRIEEILSTHLENHFGFSIPTIVRTKGSIQKIHAQDPFQGISVTPDKRLYISFLKNKVESELKLPWISEDGSYKILFKQDRMILSVLDLSVSNTPKAMEVVEKNFGKNITTRNWKTIERIIKKL